MQWMVIITESSYATLPEHKYSEYKKSHTLVHVQYHVVSS